MHANRKIYSYEGYQDILIERWNSGLIWLGKYDDHHLPELWFCRPTPRTIWLSGKPRQKYYRALREKLKSRMTTTAKKYSFITLTYHHKKYSPEEAAERSKSDIKELLRLIRRKFGKIQYFYIIELTQTGYPHFHVIIDHFIYWKVLKAMWYHITWSYVVDIRMIPSGNIAGYICKYLTKVQKQNEWQFEFIFKNIDRLWSASRGFFGKYIKPLSDCVFLAMSFGLYKSMKYILRPDEDTTFWYIPYEFAIPLLNYDIYIERRRSVACYDFLDEIQSMFSSQTINACYAYCDHFFNHVKEPFSYILREG